MQQNAHPEDTLLSHKTDKYNTFLKTYQLFAGYYLLEMTRALYKREAKSRKVQQKYVISQIKEK